MGNHRLNSIHIDHVLLDVSHLEKCCAPDEVERGAVFEREYGLISRKSEVSDVVVPAAVLRTGEDGGDSLISSEFGRIIGEEVISSSK